MQATSRADALLNHPETILFIDVRPELIPGRTNSRKGLAEMGKSIARGLGRTIDER
jgi:hypothetical protein